jgi:hypothetical protein
MAAMAQIESSDTAFPAARARAGNLAVKRFGVGHEIVVLDARIVSYFLPLAFLGAIFFVAFLIAFLGAVFFVSRLGAVFLAGPFLAVCFGPTFFAAVLTGVFLADLTGLAPAFITGFLRGGTSSLAAGGVATVAGTAGGAVTGGASDGMPAGAGGAFPSSSIVVFLPFRQGRISGTHSMSVIVLQNHMSHMSWLKMGGTQRLSIAKLFASSRAGLPAKSEIRKDGFNLIWAAETN